MNSAPRKVRFEHIGVPLMGLLFAGALIYMVASPRPEYAQIPFALTAALAFAVALTAPGLVVRATAWAAGIFATSMTLLSWALLTVDNDGEAWNDVIVWFAVAVAPVGFLWVSWRLPRARADTVVAETGLLLIGAIQLWAFTFGYSTNQSGSTEFPVTGAAVYGAVALTFCAAALIVPTRRIAYGSAALAAAVIAALAKPFFTTEETHFAGIGFATVDQLYALCVLGLPALGIVLQIGWTLRVRLRGHRLPAA